jgi:hypothetical protein
MMQGEKKLAALADRLAATCFYFTMTVRFMFTWIGQ